MESFRNIHIGNCINRRIKETETDISRICNFFKLPETVIQEMLVQESIDSEFLLKWSKVLDYDFFRLYSQHLILYSPPTSSKYQVKIKNKKYTSLQFKKSLYTREIIDFILEQLTLKEKTEQQIISDYKIPKSTLHRWKIKYKK
ncbi:transposase [Chryseobacterium jejuense]|uniref:transposase n=1 Tax=Chryseobacterium jejuense TaxID=445960 RepID=UPI001AE2C165|nr:transposase [Chryseobacterium jejuense]MBP2616978.1 hypothetical protein [Chryseobacterium jejuense]